MSFLARVASVADRPEDDADLRLRKHAFAVTAAGLIPATLLWAVIGRIIDRPVLALGSVAFALVLLISLSVLASTKAFGGVVRGLLVAGLVYVAIGHMTLGGFVAGGGSLVWGIIAPISAVLYFDTRSSTRWFVGYAGMVLGFLVLDAQLHAFIPASWSTPPIWLYAYNVLGPALIVLLLVRYVDGQRLNAQLQSHRLLHNILPRTIADQLAGGETLIAEAHESVTVLFADVVNFTGLADAMPPRDVILTLNQLFTIFDRLAERHGLEKIKTMGDAYIAVAGAPIERADHAEAAMRMAIEMQREVSHFSGLRRRTLAIRIGLASGPVTAGVIGLQKFAYDLWGGTVNLASRMEQQGLPGRIQVAPSTWQLVRDAYPWTERTVEIKGKGLMTTFVLDPADVAAAWNPPLEAPLASAAAADLLAEPATT